VHDSGNLGLSAKWCMLEGAQVKKYFKVNRRTGGLENAA